MNMKETKCPCCGKSNVREYDICNICNWENDPIQKGNPELKGGANEMSLKEAIHAFKNGKEVEWKPTVPFRCDFVDRYAG